MREQLRRHSVLFALVLAVAGCRDGTSPTTTLAISGPPDFQAVATTNTHYEFFAPSGYWVSQYEVWVAIPPSDSANAGVVVAAASPVFLRVAAQLEPVTPAAITPGDSLQVWHDITVAHGSAQAPPGAPAYSATQIVIHRPGR